MAYLCYVGTIINERSHIPTIGLNLPDTAARDFYGAPIRSIQSIGKPFSTRERLNINCHTHLLKSVYNGLQMGELYKGLTTPHHLYVHHATFPLKHTTTFSNAQTFTGNKLLLIA
jgi:hypothetical protein